MGFTRTLDKYVFGKNGTYCRLSLLCAGRIIGVARVAFGMIYLVQQDSKQILAAEFQNSFFRYVTPCLSCSNNEKRPVTQICQDVGIMNRQGGRRIKNHPVKYGSDKIEQLFHPVA